MKRSIHRQVIGAVCSVLCLLCGCAPATPADGPVQSTTTTTASTTTTTTTTTTTSTTTSTTTTTTQKTTAATSHSTELIGGLGGYTPTYHQPNGVDFAVRTTYNTDGKSISKDIRALLDAYFTYRGQTFAAAQGITLTEPDGLSISDVVRTQESTQRLAGLQRLKTIWDCEFAGAQTLYTVDGVSTSGKTTILRVHEATYFYNWYKNMTTPQTADLSGYGLRHVIYVKNGVITKDHYNEGKPTCVAIEGRLDDDEYWAYAGKEGNPPDLTDSPVITVSTGKPQFISAYNPLKAIEYANAWALARNKANYKDYHAIGGDCANFTSQCMTYGGMPHSDNWYWKGGNTGKGAYCWKTATGMWNYFKNSKRGKPIAMIECIDETGRTARYNGKIVAADTLFYAGSPVFYRWKGGFAEDGEWSHATICVGKLGDGTPTISCHTEDRYNFKWTYGGTTCEYSCMQLTADNPVA